MSRANRLSKAINRDVKMHKAKIDYEKANLILHNHDNGNSIDTLISKEKDPLSTDGQSL